MKPIRLLMGIATLLLTLSVTITQAQAIDDIARMEVLFEFDQELTNESFSSQNIEPYEEYAFKVRTIIVLPENSSAEKVLLKITRADTDVVYDQVLNFKNNVFPDMNFSRRGDALYFNMKNTVLPATSFSVEATLMDKEGNTSNSETFATD